MFKKIILLLAMAAFLGPASSFAATYPTRPVTIIVPFAAGGETDIIARLLAENMGKILGQRVAVQNIVGASGTAGINAILLAKPDGYTLGFSPSAPLAIHPHLREVPHKLDSFTYIGRAVLVPYFLITQKNSPWNSVSDMVKDMQAHPGKYFWASAGVGSVPYMAISSILSAYALDAKHVPFTGDPDAFQALAGDRAQLYASSGATLSMFDVKPLAVMAEQRDPLWPGVPTFKETGKDIYSSQWMILFAHKDVPAQVSGVISDALAKAVVMPEFLDQLQKLGMTASYLDSAAATEFVKAEYTRNAEIIKELSAQE